MKKISIAFVLIFVLLSSFGPVIIQAGAEDMNFNLVSMYDKIEMVKVTDTEGVVIGVVDRKGLSIFDKARLQQQIAEEPSTRKKDLRDILH